MSDNVVDRIVQSVLYQDYMLYPYRLISIKNRHRWTTGVVYPKAFSTAQGGRKPCVMQAECLLIAHANPEVSVMVRFLRVAAVGASEEIFEERITSPNLPLVRSAETLIDHSFSRGDLQGHISFAARPLDERLFRIQLRVTNLSSCEERDQSRERVLFRSLICTHSILTATGGEFASLIEPPGPLKEAAATCSNLGSWPVLVGREPERHCMLSSPIILNDYPQIASESPGDLFDATELDELLTLRILTLSEEKEDSIWL